MPKKNDSEHVIDDVGDSDDCSSRSLKTGYRRYWDVSVASRPTIEKWIIGLCLMVSGLLTMTCLMQVASLRVENAEIRQHIEMLSGNLVRCIEQHGKRTAPRRPDFTDETLLNDVTAEGNSPLDRQRRDAVENQHAIRHGNRHRHSVVHFVLNEDHLGSRIQEQKHGGDPVNYASSDVIWTEAPWGSTGRLHLNEDHRSVTVDQPGVYFVYAQVTFMNVQAKSAFHVQLNGDVILKCMQSVNADVTMTSGTRLEEHTTGAGSSHVINRNDALPKTCHTSGVFLVSSGDRMSIRLQNRAVVCDEQSNYWGLVKLHDS